MNLKRLFIGILILLIVGAVMMSCSSDNKTKDAKVVEAEKYAEQHIKTKYQGIKSITFTEHETNPMGILMIRGYINKDKDKTFSLHYDFKQKDVIAGGVDAQPK